MRVNTLFKYWISRLFSPGAALRATYDAFRDLLVHDRRSHELMAELEALYYQGKKEGFCRIGARYDALSASVGGMAESLEPMAPGSFLTLGEYFRKFDFYGRFLLAPPALRWGPPFVLPLTGDFPPTTGLRFSNFETISGRFVQQYFQAMVKKP